MNDSLQGISPPLKAAQAGPIPASEAKVGPYLKILHQTVQVELHCYAFFFFLILSITTETKDFHIHFSEEYLYVVKSPGQQSTEAQVRTPLLGPTGPACTLSFEYALTGNPGHIGEWSHLPFLVYAPDPLHSHLVDAAGELSLRVIDSLRGVEPRMWTFAGKTGREPDSWRSVSLTVGARKHRFQV